MPTAETIDRQIPFQEAIDYLAEKTNLDTDTWIEGQGLIQTVAFTVAGAKGRVLQDIRDAVNRAIQDGISIRDFAKQFNTIADSYVDNWQLKGDRAWRGQLIYEQNLRQAYGAGRYAQMTDPDVLNRRPYWQWVHGDSRAPRPVHLALDGKVFPADSLPFHPPSGFSCKCQVFSLSQRDVDREGLQVEHLEHGQDIDYTDPNGQTRTAQLLPDPGFDWKPTGKLTKERQAELLKGLDPDIRKLVFDTEAEFAKIPEGAIRMRSGKLYILKDSRWHLHQRQSQREDMPFTIGKWISLLESSPDIESDKDFFTRFQSLHDDIGQLDPTKDADRLAATRTKITDAIARREKELFKGLDAAAGLRQELFESGLSRSAATALVDKIDFTGIKEHVRPIIRDTAIEFFQLTNGVGSKALKSFKYTEDRAHNSGDYINIGNEIERSIFYHELGHGAEDELPKHGSVDWIKSRATGPERPLQELAPDASYDAHEKAYPDRFYDPYVGKTYSDGGTEAISMGIEKFTSPKDMLKLWHDDADHFKLIVNFIQKTRRV
jgi:hypothetical protein